ncbi:MAG: hypothetical protein Ct9H90mP15_08800 [Candidatus Neomarinimicrobiota bacterium]|nr:MAG: hypothetical protein Ct9H90mP15_08800 [Candidatus Neomarinimicrobiota bacterium]
MWGSRRFLINCVGEEHLLLIQQQGGTRDRVYASGEWLDKKFDVIDTGVLLIQMKMFLMKRLESK